MGPETKLVIHGQTNINSFQCRMTCYNQADTLTYTMDDDECMLFFNQNQMKIPVRSFDCENKLINQDFYQTLKSEKHPFVNIQFVALDRWIGTPKINGTVYITLAGVTRSYIISYQVRKKNNVLYLKGTQNICFSEFQMDAPKKLMGMIQVKDSIAVEFFVQLEEAL